MISAGALAERGDSRGPLKPEGLADVIGVVVIHESEQSVRLDALEEVRDLAGLTGGGGSAGLGDEYRVIGELAHGRQWSGRTGVQTASSA